MTEGRRVQGEGRHEEQLQVRCTHTEGDADVTVGGGGDGFVWGRRLQWEAGGNVWKGTRR